MPSITDMIDARIARFMRALRLPYRARLSALNGDPALQMAQGKGLAGETVQAVEVLQQFGFSSGIPADSQLIVLPLAGRSSASVVIATEHGAYRLKVGPGEARMPWRWWHILSEDKYAQDRQQHGHAGQQVYRGQSYRPSSGNHSNGGVA